MKLYLIYTFVYLVILYTTIFFSKKMKFYDAPGFRKIHKKKILNTSGVSMYIYLLLIIYLNELSFHMEQIIATGFFVVLLGFIDDRMKISPSVKLILIILPATYLIMNDFQLNDLGSYDVLGKLNLGKFGFVFTILAVGLITNSFNYIDGIDGLLSSITITNLIYIFILENNEQIRILILLIIIPLVINLIFNLLPNINSNKIFLGDSGSLFLGFFIGFLMIFLYKYRGIHPAYLIWIAWYPISDFIFVTICRIFNNKKFYMPDKMHLHHKLLSKLNSSQIKSTIVISAFNTCVLAIGFFVTKYLGNFYSLVLFLLLNIKFLFIRFYFQHRGVEQSGSSSGS